MSDLLGAVINYATTATTPQASALQTLLSGGSGLFGFFQTGEPREYPYCAVSELHFETLEQVYPFYRVDCLTLQFEVFARTASQVDQIQSAIEAVYLSCPPADLVVDRYKVMNYPFMRDRMKFRELDNYRGVLNLEWGLDLIPQGI